jgi:hypothetical protein
MIAIVDPSQADAGSTCRVCRIRPNDKKATRGRVGRFELCAFSVISSAWPPPAGQSRRPGPPSSAWVASAPLATSRLCSCLGDDSRGHGRGRVFERDNAKEGALTWTSTSFAPLSAKASTSGPR